MKITESSEHCKETFKKFGVLTISSEILTTLYLFYLSKGGQESRGGELLLQLINISFLFPLFFAVLDIIQVRKIFKNIKNRLKLECQRKRELKNKVEQ